MSFTSLVTHRNDMPMSTPSEHSPHWAEIVCLQICLAPEPGCLWLMSISLAPACGCTFPNVHWWDQVKSHEEIEEMLKASWKSLHHLQTSWRGHCDKKKSPLSPSILNSCHINNLLHWDVQTPHEQFPSMSHEASRRKTQCAFILMYLAMKPFCKTNVPRETPF